MTTRTEMAHAESCCWDCGHMLPCLCQTRPSGCEFCGSKAVKAGTCPRCEERQLVAAGCPCVCGDEIAVAVINGVPLGELCLDSVRPAVPSTRPGPLSATA